VSAALPAGSSPSALEWLQLRKLTVFRGLWFVRAKALSTLGPPDFSRKPTLSEACPPFRYELALFVYGLGPPAPETSPKGGH
jgi:hypothetical protein